MVSFMWLRDVGVCGEGGMIEAGYRRIVRNETLVVTERNRRLPTSIL